MNKRYLIILFSLFSVSFYSQGYDRDITYGVSFGGTYSKMGGISSSIIPEHLYRGYTANEKLSLGISGGLFLNWKSRSNHFSISPELWYSRQKTDFVYEDEKGLHYNIGFNYNYLNAGFLLKYYFTEGLYIGAGPFFSFNLSRDNLTYKSNGSDISKHSGVYFEPDALVQKVLKESFEGKDYFHLAFALGYEFENNLGIGLRYQLGISDAMDTKDNGHRFRDTQNKVNAISLQLSYRFSFDSQNNF